MKKKKVNPFGSIDDILGIEKPDIPQFIPEPPIEDKQEIVDGLLASKIEETEVIPHRMSIPYPYDDDGIRTDSSIRLSSDAKTFDHTMGHTMLHRMSEGMKPAIEKRINTSFASDPNPSDSKPNKLDNNTVKFDTSSKNKLSLLKLSYHQTKMLSVIVKNIISNNEIMLSDTVEYNVSGPITNHDFKIDVPVLATQKSIKKRFKDLVGMETIHTCAGQNGYSIYGFKKTTLQDVIEALNRNLSTLGTQKHEVHRMSYGMRNGMSNGIEESYEPPLVSKLVNNTKLTNTSESLIPDEIDISKLSGYGITKKHLNDLRNQRLDLTTMTLQDFVNRFAVYASNPSNIKNVGSLPGLFCKMAQLVSKGEDPLADVESDEDLAIKTRIVLLKRKKEERERLEAELLTLEFDDWFASFKIEEVLDLVPEARMVSKSETRINIIKQFYINNVWRKE